MKLKIFHKYDNFEIIKGLQNEEFIKDNRINYMELYNYEIYIKNLCFYHFIELIENDKEIIKKIKKKIRNKCK